MKIFGFEITRKKEMVSAVGGYGFGGGFLNYLHEGPSGGWQRGIVTQPLQNVTAFSAVYACVSLIAEDIAKLRLKLVQLKTDGTWIEAPNTSPFWNALVKPNRFQTRIQFLSQWMTSKLLHGNTYVYKEREQNRGMVTNLYVLDPRRVTPMVADDGSVWYQIKGDKMAAVGEIVVPDSEIIHDRAVTLFHPLVGVSPVYACGVSATQGMRIQDNSEAFFRNMSRPSGQLTAPGTIQDVTATRLKSEFEKNFSSGNLGRLLVTGDGLKYEPFSIPAVDAQLIQQLEWTVQDVARCFRVPLHKISGGENPKFTNMAALNQDYYVQTLQSHIEAIEVLMDEGLAVPRTMGVELDLDGLLRMDPGAMNAALKDAVQGSVMTPNEARSKINLPPVKGGDSVYMQQQNFSTEALAKRDDLPNPFVLDHPTPNTTPSPDNQPPAPPAPDANSGAKVIDLGARRRRYGRKLRKAA